MTVDELLAYSDGNLGAMVVSSMCSSPTPENFAALGRIIRAGTPQDLEAMLRRGGRRPRPSPSLPLFDSLDAATPRSTP